MKTRYRKILTILAVIAAGCVFLFLLKGEKFLRIDSKIGDINADAVVVLAGSYKEDKERIAEGADLIRQGKGNVLILPLRHPAIDWPWVVQYFDLPQDLPEHQVHIGRSTPKDEPIIEKFGGTYVEAHKTVELLQRLDLKSAIIVSSAYHMRRAQMAFDRYRSSTHIEFYYHPVETGLENNRLWWLNAKYLNKILKEYKKVLAALIVYNRHIESAQ